MTLQEVICRADDEKVSHLRVGVNAHLSGIEFVKANSINYDVDGAYDYATLVGKKFCVTMEEISEALEQVEFRKYASAGAKK